MAGEIRDARDDLTAPMVDDLLDLVSENLPGHAQVALVFIGKAGADFQCGQVRNETDDVATSAPP